MTDESDRFEAMLRSRRPNRAALMIERVRNATCRRSAAADMAGKAQGGNRWGNRAAVAAALIVGVFLGSFSTWLILRNSPQPAAPPVIVQTPDVQPADVSLTSDDILLAELQKRRSGAILPERDILSAPRRRRQPPIGPMRRAAPDSLLADPET